MKISQCYSIRIRLCLNVRLRLNSWDFMAFNLAIEGGLFRYIFLIQEVNEKAEDDEISTA